MCRKVVTPCPTCRITCPRRKWEVERPAVVAMWMCGAPHLRHWAAYFRDHPPFRRRPWRSTTPPRPSSSRWRVRARSVVAAAATPIRWAAAAARAATATAATAAPVGRTIVASTTTASAPWTPRLPHPWSIRTAAGTAPRPPPPPQRSSSAPGPTTSAAIPTTSSSKPRWSWWPRLPSGSLPPPPPPAAPPCPRSRST